MSTLPGVDSCSALFKLSNHHSCELFDEGTQYDSQTAPRVRECLQRSLYTINDICSQFTALMQEIQGLLTQDALKIFSPLMLNCVYTCAQNILWMLLETDNPQLTSAKLVSEDILRFLDSRWMSAGYVSLDLS
jgi:hypothetical protein